MEHSWTDLVCSLGLLCSRRISFFFGFVHNLSQYKKTPYTQWHQEKGRWIIHYYRETTTNHIRLPNCNQQDETDRRISPAGFPRRLYQRRQRLEQRSKMRPKEPRHQHRNR